MDQINEKESATFSSVLYDDSGAVIAKAAINTFTVTVYDKTSETVINSRSSLGIGASPRLRLPLLRQGLYY